MSRFKNLKVLSVAITLIFFTNISIFANEKIKNNDGKFSQSEDKDNYFGKKVSRIKGEKMPIENIGGFNFKKIAKNISEGTLFFHNNEKFSLAVALNDKKPNNTYRDNFSVKVIFNNPVFNDEGQTHRIEHILTDYLRDTAGIEKDAWFSTYTRMVLPVFTSKTRENEYSDFKNCYLELKFTEEFFDKKERWQVLGKALNGELLSDKERFMEYFKAEVSGKYKNKITSRMIAEISGKENSKAPNYVTLTDENRQRKEKGIFEYFGNINEFKNDSSKKTEEFYEKYIVKGHPIVILNCKTKKEAAEKISYLNKYYFKNKEKVEFKEFGKLKHKPKEFLKRTALDTELSSFISFYKQRKNKNVNNMVKITFSGDSLTMIEQACLCSLKEGYIEKIVDSKKLGFGNFYIVNEHDGIDIKINGNENKNFSFSKENLLNFAKEIKEKLLEKIKNKGITKEDLDGHMLASFARHCEDRNITFEEMLKMVDDSLRRYNKPFSEKYFILDKNNNVVKDMQKIMPLVEDYFIKNCDKILKKILEKPPIIEHIVKPKGRNNDDVQKEFKKSYDIEENKLPIKYSKVKNETAAILAEESILKLLYDSLVKKGLLYRYPEVRESIYEYPKISDLSKIEKINLQTYFKEDFKNDLDKLEKKIMEDDKYMTAKRERYAKVLENQEQKIKNIKKIQEEGINHLEEIRNKVDGKIKKSNDILTIMDEIRKNRIDNRMLDIIDNAKNLLFLTRDEKNTYDKIFEKLAEKEDFEMKNCYYGPENKDIKKIKNKIKRLIDLDLQIVKNFVLFENRILEKMRKHHRNLENVNRDEVLEILKGIVVEDFEKINIIKDKKDKSEIKRMKKKLLQI